MKKLEDLLLLGNPLLYEKCEPVLPSELPLVVGWVADLDNVMKEIRAKYNFGGNSCAAIGDHEKIDLYEH
jgi:peptide deformylase